MAEKFEIMINVAHTPFHLDGGCATRQVKSYRELYEDTMLMNEENDDDTLYQQFFDAMSATNIGYFCKVQHLIAESERDDALELLESIEDTNTIESNLKTVLYIYMNTIMIGEDIDESDTTDLTDIAYQKPWEGGDAVYMAREMLRLDVGDYDEEEERYAFLQQPSPHQSFPHTRLLYPNPANNSLTLAYVFEENETGFLVIYDLIGKKIKEFELKNANSNIDITELDGGVYLYKLTIADMLTETDKMVIIK